VDVVNVIGGIVADLEEILFFEERLGGAGHGAERR
jgi:hypothetical protein